jgi:MFS family permease
MVTMPIGGKLTDRVGPGRVVLLGLVIVVASVATFTGFLQADTSYWILGAILFVMGLGMGLTMMPTMAAAIQTLVHDEVPRASTMLNIFQQVSASVGTALMSVLLANSLADKLGTPSGGGLSATQNISPQAIKKIAAPMADAFQHTYWWAVGLLTLAFIPALFLSRRSPDVTSADESPAEVPVPMH